MKKNKHASSNTLLGLGAVLTFLGFVWPGWLWVMLTPGDVEMLPLAAITIVGIAGILILIVGALWRVRESRKKAAQEED